MEPVPPPSSLLLLAVLLAAGQAPPPPPPPPPPPRPSSAQCLDSSCFALFWAARSFAAAGAACGAAGGRLMWARSSVAAEAIELLRRGRAGAAWLGLRLPEGRCAEASRGRLRGFQWVAGDERSDYAAWADGAAGGCGPRCVAVSAALLWEERACELPADGFLCEYSYPGGTSCPPLALPPGTPVAYDTPFGARDGDLSAFPPGSTADVPSLAASLRCQERANGSWGWSAAAPGAWHCQLERGGCEGQCQEDERGRPFCTCPEGTALHQDGRSCLSPCAQLRCEHQCVPQGDHGVCMCQEGYELAADGRSCHDIDDCKGEPRPCEQKCINTAGGFRCLCFASYSLVAGRCTRNEHLCFHKTCQHDCIMVNGTARCECFPGFVPDRKDPDLCVRFCNRTECPPQCDPHTGEECYCPDGYILQELEGDTKVCTDIDECQENYCDGECVNLLGGYECISPGTDVYSASQRPDEDEGSGDMSLPPTQTPTVFTSVPPRAGHSPKTLVAIIVSTVLAFLVLAAALYCVLRKLATSPGRMDYKSRQLQTEVVMEQVRPESSSSKQKM